MAKGKPRMHKARIINLDEIDREELDRRICRALATALYRSLEPEQIDQIIYQLKQEVKRKEALDG